MTHLFHLTRLSFFAAILLFLSCRKDQEATVKVRFVNGSITDIYQAKAANISIGTLRSEESTEYFSFNKINPETGFPDIEFSGIINNEMVGSITFIGWCGVGQTVMDGTYTCLVVPSVANGVPVLQLTFK